MSGELSPLAAGVADLTLELATRTSLAKGDVS